MSKRRSRSRQVASAVWNYAHGTQGVILSRDPNLARQNPVDYVTGAEITIKKALALAKRTVRGFAPEQIVGIGVDTTGSTPIPVDRQGRLISCEHLGRRVSRTEHDGTITVIADSHKGKRLNSPNDVVVKSDGTIWFTDPPFGLMGNYEGEKAEQELPLSWALLPLACCMSSHATTSHLRCKAGSRGCENGYHEFDFMRGDEEYKYRFGGVNKYVMRARSIKL